MPIDENGVGHSQYSSDKQRMLRALLSIHLRMTSGAMQKFGRPNGRYYYFDLHAGPGITDQYGVGSPIIFLEAAERHKQEMPGFRYSALMVDENKTNVESLTREIDQRRYYNAAVTCANNNTILREYAVSGYYGKAFGLFYCDPNAPGDMPWSGLINIARAWPFGDMLFRLPATSFKRCQHQKAHRPLREYLDEINKRNKSIMDHEGRHQWTFIYLSNGPAISWPGARFYDVNSRNGQRVWKEITETAKERQRELQPALL